RGRRSALTRVTNRRAIDCRQARHEEVFAAAEHVERLDGVNPAAHGVFRDGEYRVVLLQPDVWIAFGAQVHEVSVVDPLLLQEFDRLRRPGADEDEVGTAWDFIVVLRHRVWIVRRAERRAAANDAMEVHIGQLRQLRVARIHATRVRAERDSQSLRVAAIREIVVALRIGAERRIVVLWSQLERSTAAPTAYELGGEQLSLFVGRGVLLQEPIERSDGRLIYAETGKGAVASESVWNWR